MATSATRSMLTSDHSRDTMSDDESTFAVLDAVPWLCCVDCRRRVLRISGAPFAVRLLVDEAARVLSTAAYSDP